MRRKASRLLVFLHATAAEARSDLSNAGSSCEKNGRAAECTSTNDQFARGKERSYVSTLETRIERLMVKLEEAKARKPSVVSLPDDDNGWSSRRPSEQPAETEPATPNMIKMQKRREVYAIDDLVSDFGYLSVNATARDFYGFTAAMSYARLILSACSKQPLPFEVNKALPTRSTIMPLIEDYMKSTFLLLPAFDETSLYLSIDNVYSRKADAFDHWMVRLVLAISCASKSAQHGDQRHLEGCSHLAAALEVAEQVLHPGAISNIQALILLTEYATLDPKHFDSWNLIGAASRAMADLGLHQDPPKGTAMTKGKLHLRRRVFHCIYALDRSISLVQTRAFSFSDESAVVKVPFNTPENGNGQSQSWGSSYEHALDLIKLRQLQSEWYTDMFQSGREPWKDPYPYLWRTCFAMRGWFEHLAPSTPPHLRAVFELEFLYSNIYLLSTSPRIPIPLPFAQTLIFEHCMRYSDILHDCLDNQEFTSLINFYDAMRAYLIGRQFLDVMQRNADVLLAGITPEMPEAQGRHAPPPPIPKLILPPGENITRVNISRASRCIRQFGECLARLAARWGYRR